ncbi:MAG: DUF2330 domain-containing protein [Candidatus Pacebacteria bacterium]|nr:DUF2330 domain-containing protein [Candidatus Paceibacterota bacterium]
MFRKIFSGFLIAIYLLPNLVLADGMMIKPDPYGNRWDFVSESNQQAYINYEDGLEKLILSIGLEEADSGAVWIFPVPANPERVVIDILTEMPDLRGEEINNKAKSELENIKEPLLLTQIYPAVFSSLSRKSTVLVENDRAGWGSAPVGYGQKSDVIIYEHLEKEGITTEIITAQTSDGLQKYFKSKKLNIEQNSIPALDHYIGKEFTFVASWISKNPAAKSGSKQKGVFVTFPTKKLYYPLMLTSVYGSERIPTTIRIMGFVSPKVFENIENYTEIEYYVDNNIYLSIDNFYNGSTKNVKYTKIEMNAPSKLLTQDLWMNTRQPLKTFIPLFISQHAFTTGMILLVFISILAGVLAGFVTFREARSKKGILKFGLLGFFNCLTIIALIIRLSSLKIKTNEEKDQKLINKLKEQGYSISKKDSNRKMIFIPLYSITYIVLVILILMLIEKSL